MDGWLEFAAGPLFGLTFLVMVVGLARHVFLQARLFAVKGTSLARVNWRRVMVDAARWLLPAGRLARGTLVLTLASFTFHAGAVLVPLFYAGHVVMWEGLLGVWLPRLPYAVADSLTLLSIGCLAVVAGYRVLVAEARASSRTGDYAIPLLVLAPFVSGYLAAHPEVNPLPWQSTILFHVLSAELLFVTVPFTKLAHVVLFVFDHLSPIHWQLRPGSGDRVASACYGERAGV